MRVNGAMHLESFQVERAPVEIHVRWSHPDDNATVKAIRMQKQQDIAAQRAMEEIEQASKASKNLSKTMEEGSPMKPLTEGGEA